MKAESEDRTLQMDGYRAGIRLGIWSSEQKGEWRFPTNSKADMASRFPGRGALKCWQLTKGWGEEGRLCPGKMCSVPREWKQRGKTGLFRWLTTGLG